MVTICATSVLPTQIILKKPFLSTISEKCTTKYNEMSFRCVLCRAKILRLKQHHKGQHGPHRRPVGVPALQPQELSDASVPQSVSNYSITRLSSSSSNHSFASGKIVILFLPHQNPLFWGKNQAIDIGLPSHLPSNAFLNSIADNNHRFQTFCKLQPIHYLQEYIQPVI